MNTARRLWERSRPVPASPEHPARRWAARRHLWPPGDPWPDSVRWLAGAGGGGSLVGCFAPVAEWVAGGGGVPTPSGVQLVHVAADGKPRKDRGGVGKRSHGIMTGAVCVLGGPLGGAGRLHVAEGIADALAIAARCGGAAVATGGTATLPRLAEPLAALSLPVLIHADGDPAGIVPARRLLAALARRGIVAAIRQYEPGGDPAEP